MSPLDMQSHNLNVKRIVVFLCFQALSWERGGGATLGCCCHLTFLEGGETLKGGGLRIRFKQSGEARGRQGYEGAMGRAGMGTEGRNEVRRGEGRKEQRGGGGAGRLLIRVWAGLFVELHFQFSDPAA